MVTNFHGLTLYQKKSNVQNSIFIKLFLDYYRAHGMIDSYATGGNGGSLSIKYWNFMKFPNFPEEKEKAIVDTFVYLKNGGKVDFSKMSETLFAWCKKQLANNG